VRFDRFTIVLLYRNEHGPDFTDDERDALQDAHLNHLATLHEAGTLIAAGPTGVGNPDEVLRGVSVLNVGVDEARALKEADPAVQAGLFSIRCLPWMVPAGAVSYSATRFPHSVAETQAD
jgi:uncharacterized protein YciI